MADDFDMSMDDITGDSNAGAYRKTEVRQGPPLEYVSEKIEHSLTDLHATISIIDRVIQDSERKDTILFSAKAAFQQELVALLALQNLLNTANTPGLLQHLLGLSVEDFEEWLQQDEMQHARPPSRVCN
jgi:hypothetical protein